MARIKVLSARFSADEYLRIAAAADAAGLQPGAWLRRRVLDGAESTPGAPPSSKPTPSGTAEKLARTASTRFTHEQHEALAEHARACGMPVARYIRNVVLGSNPVARRPLARSAIVAVNRVGNNLNQLVHLAHTGVVLAPDLVHVLREVHDHFLALQNELIASDTAEGEEHHP